MLSSDPKHCYHVIYNTVITWSTTLLSRDQLNCHHVIYYTVITWSTTLLSCNPLYCYHVIYFTVIMWSTTLLSYNPLYCYHVIYYTVITWSPTRITCHVIYLSTPSSRSRYTNHTCFWGSTAPETGCCMGCWRLAGAACAGCTMTGWEMLLWGYSPLLTT